jgi:hypothetical protein
MKTRQQIAHEAGVTEAQLDAVEDELHDRFPDPADRAEFIKGCCELQRIAKENNMTLEELIQGVTKWRQ